MANQQALKQTVIQARKDVKKRNFSQSFELIVSFKDLDLKKQPLNLNEIVRLPNNFGKIPKICVFASGDLALRAEKVGVDDLFNEDELNVLLIVDFNDYISNLDFVINSIKGVANFSTCLLLDKMDSKIQKKVTSIGFDIVMSKSVFLMNIKTIKNQIKNSINKSQKH